MEFGQEPWIKDKQCLAVLSWIVGKTLGGLSGLCPLLLTLASSSRTFLEAAWAANLLSGQGGFET